MDVNTRDSVGKRVVVALIIVAVLVVGSFFYWRGEGQPGTPDEFRRRVAEAGLDVAWANAGPRGGDGVVQTTCGAVDVTISDMDDQLWIRWADHQARLTDGTIEVLLSCAR